MTDLVDLKYLFLIFFCFAFIIIPIVTFLKHNYFSRRHKNFALKSKNYGFMEFENVKLHGVKNQTLFIKQGCIVIATRNLFGLKDQLRVYYTYLPVELNSIVWRVKLVSSDLKGNTIQLKYGYDNILVSKLKNSIYCKFSNDVNAQKAWSKFSN